jgi:hypothetical protein
MCEEAHLIPESPQMAAQQLAQLAAASASCVPGSASVPVSALASPGGPSPRVGGQMPRALIVRRKVAQSLLGGVGLRYRWAARLLCSTALLPGRRCAASRLAPWPRLRLPLPPTAPAQLLAWPFRP